MSTLTKVLIVLLTVFSIFLCGIVVTYVANADNQKKIAQDATRDLRAARTARRPLRTTWPPPRNRPIRCGGTWKPR